MQAALTTANYGLQMISRSTNTDGKSVEIQSETKNSVSKLIQEYKAAGGGNEFDKIIDKKDN